MTSEPIKVLLVEDNPENIRLIREMFKEAKPALAPLEDAPSLLAAVERLAKGGIDAVLLDLGLLDSQGISTFVDLHKQFPRTPIVVLTGLTDEKLGLQAVREGAQDYSGGEIGGTAGGLRCETPSSLVPAFLGRLPSVPQSAKLDGRNHLSPPDWRRCESNCSRESLRQEPSSLCTLKPKPTTSIEPSGLSLNTLQSWDLSPS